MFPRVAPCLSRISYRLNYSQGTCGFVTSLDGAFLEMFLAAGFARCQKHHLKSRCGAGQLCVPKVYNGRTAADLLTM
jgi:hypothetical protein